jgi:hypothetical protein
MAKRQKKAQTPAVFAGGDEALGVSVDALPDAPGFVGIVSKRTSGEKLAEITEAVGHALPHGCVYLRAGDGEVHDLTGCPVVLFREMRYWGRHDYDARGALVEAVATKAEADKANASREKDERLRESWLVLAAHILPDGTVKMSLSRQQDGSSRWCERLARGIASAERPEFLARAKRMRGAKVSEALTALPPRYRVMGVLEGDTSRGYNLISSSVAPLDARAIEALSEFGNSEKGAEVVSAALATYESRAETVREAF